MKRPRQGPRIGQASADRARRRAWTRNSIVKATAAARAKRLRAVQNAASVTAQSERRVALSAQAQSAGGPPSSGPDPARVADLRKKASQETRAYYLLLGLDVDAMDDLELEEVLESEEAQAQFERLMNDEPAPFDVNAPVVEPEPVSGAGTPESAPDPELAQAEAEYDALIAELDAIQAQAEAERRKALRCQHVSWTVALGTGTRTEDAVWWYSRCDTCRDYQKRWKDGKLEELPGRPEREPNPARDDFEGGGSPERSQFDRLIGRGAPLADGQVWLDDL